MLPFWGRSAAVTPEVATFAGGCFWGVEHIFLKHYPPSQSKGILKTVVGYIGGNTDDPTYWEVRSGNTNHAEALRIEFDPTIVTYAELVGECSVVLTFSCSEVGRNC
jgi:peptide-methionine (S)-S-oxide reductase